MAEQATPQAGTPAFLAEGSTTPQPASEPVVQPATEQTETEKLKAALQNDPSNYRLWKKAVAAAVAAAAENDDTDAVNSAFDGWLAAFPDDDKIWIRYASYHLQKDNRAKVEEIFKTCINMRSLPLWELYLNKFVVKYNSLISGGRQALGNIIKAHEFALVDVGLDYHADKLYDNELAIVESFNAINEDQNAEKRKIKLQILRKAIKGPTKKIQNYWNQYIETCPKTEIQLNSAEYLKVKTFVGQLASVIANLDPAFHQDDKLLNDAVLSQFSVYQNWINFERENRLELPADLLAKRVDYAYTLALRALPFIPELWIEYSHFKLASASPAPTKGNAALEILSKGVKANPSSFAVCLSVAEILEVENNVDAAKAVYEDLIASLTRSYDVNAAKVAEIVEAQEKKIRDHEAALAAERRKQREDNEEKKFDDDDDDDGYVPGSKPLLAHSAGLKNDFHLTAQLQSLEALNTRIGVGVTLAYCAYLRFAKRSLEFNETRKIFSKGKKFPGHSWHIYSTSANVENSNSNSKVAIKVYELAMKKSKFAKNIDFILDYLRFLVSTDDRTNAKALFETSVKNFDADPDALKTLYLEYIKIENAQADDLRAVKALEDRFSKKFPEINSLMAMSDRLKVSDFDVITEFDYYGGFDKYAKKFKVNGGNRGSKKRKLQDAPDPMDVDVETPYAGSAPDNMDVEEDEDPLLNQPFVQDEIYNLLRVLPKASYCQPSMFDEKNLVSFLRSLDGGS